MRVLVFVMALGAVAGCSSPPAADNAAVGNQAANAAPAPAPAPMLGKVDLSKPLRAAGTEPYWVLDIAPGELSFTDYSAEAPKAEPFFPVAPVVADGKATYTTKNTADAGIVLTLTLEECLEVGEPEDAQPLTAELRIGERTLKGCAGPRPAEAKDEGANNSAPEKP